MSTSSLTCMDCGESPILGTFYARTDKSHHVCQVCLQENRCELMDDYDRCASVNGEDYSHAVANTYQELVTILLAGTVREIDFYITTGVLTPPPNPDFLRILLARNTQLKSLQVFVRGNNHLAPTVQALAEAIKNSPSIVLLRFSLCATQPQFRSDQVAPALQDLLQTNPKLRYFYFRSISRFPLDGIHTVDRVGNSLFQGLFKSSLYRFTYDGHVPTSVHNKQQAIRAIRTNPQLKSIDSPFETQDSQLELAVHDRDYQWSQRWVDYAAEQQLQVLQEIQTADFEDKLNAYYWYFLQSPAIILENANPVR